MEDIFGHLNPIRIEWRETAKEINETLTVLNNRITLTEVPARFQRVTIDGYVEINGNGQIPDANEFKVNYRNGIVEFGGVADNTIVSVHYYGLGILMTPANRIYSHNKNYDIYENLQWMIDHGQDGIDALIDISGFEHKGDYDNASTYRKYNIVLYKGAAYICIKDDHTSIVGIPPSDSEYWKRLSAYKWMGTYSSSTTYYSGDFVTDANKENLYISLESSNLGNPLDDTNSWKLVVSVEEVINSAEAAADLANARAAYAQEKGDYAQTQGEYANAQAEYANDVANSMDFKGDYDPTLPYEERNIVEYSGLAWMAIQDVPVGTTPLDGAYWRKISNETTLNSQTYTNTTQGQTDFTITNGSYKPNYNHLSVWVGGVPQSPSAFTETSTTTFSLTEGLPEAGIEVYAEWYEGAVSITKGHMTTHELGGQDELDVTKLKNYEPEIANKIGVLFDTTGINTAHYPKISGESDDTLRIQRMIDNAPDGSKFIFLNLKYTLSSQGSFTHTFTDSQKNYGIYVKNRKKLTFIFLEGSEIEWSIDDSNHFNAFVFEGCQDIDIYNIKGSGIGSMLQEDLYNGSLVLTQNCNDVNVTNPVSTNARGNTLHFYGTNVHTTIGKSSIQPLTEAGTHFGLYACHQSSIKDCITYGGCSDGEIGVYGSPTRDIKIQGNKCFNYKEGDTDKIIDRIGAQGIYIDSGAYRVNVSENYAYGYYYGIDVKTNTEGVLVYNNTTEKCFRCIAVRRGEGQQPTNNTSVFSNIIRPDGGNGSVGIPHGVLIEDSFGTKIENNDFSVTLGEGQKNFIPIYATMSDGHSRAYQKGLIISNNSFTLENRIGIIEGYSKLEAIVIKGTGMRNVNIASNLFDPFYGGSEAPLLRIENAIGLGIKGNQIGDHRGFYSISLDNCSNTTINGNEWNYHNGILTAINCKALTFTGNTSFESLYGVGRSTIHLDSVTFGTFNSNTYTRYGAAYADDYYIKSVNTSDYLNIDGNTLELANNLDFDLVGTNNKIGTQNIIA